MTPPERPPVTWEDYIQAQPGQTPCLGRQLMAKENAKAFKATVAMVRRVACLSLFLGSYLKTTGAITMKFGYILEKRMLNPSTMPKKMYLIIVQS